MSLSPNMSMLLPSPSVTLGPEWASELNTALLVVDSHNHAPGSGAPISFSALSADIDLNFGLFNGTNLRTLRLSDQTSISLTSSDVRSLYSKSGELYYRDAAGNQVVITSGGSIAGTNGSIAGLISPASASFSGGRFTFNADTSEPGKLSIADIDLYEYSNSLAQPITIKSPSGVSAYSLTLPATPPSVLSVMTMASDGTVSTGGVSAGSPSAPIFTFAADPDTGMYSEAANVLAFATGGVKRLDLSGSGCDFRTTLSVVSGAVGLPGVNIVGDTDTGIYSSGANTLDFATGGTNRLSISSAASVFSTRVNIPTSSFSAPAIYGADSTTGFWLDGAGEANIAVSGVNSYRFLPNGLRGPDGSASLAAFAFTSDATLGLYKAAANQLGVTIGGANRATFTTSGLSIVAGLTVGTGITAANISASGAVNGTSGVSAGSASTAIKWKVFTGTLTSGSSSSLFTPGGSIVGATGYDATNGTPISPSGATALAWTVTGDGTHARIVNNLGFTVDYTVTLFYT